MPSLPGVGGGLSQVVQVAHGDRRQRSVFRLAKDLTGPLTELLDRRATGGGVALIHRGQQADIFFGVLSFETGQRALTTFELDPSCDTGQSAGAAAGRISH